MQAFSFSDSSNELLRLRETAQLIFCETDQNVETDTNKCVHKYLRKMYADVDAANKFKLSIDDLSMKTQNFYQAFSKHMDTNKIYAGDSMLNSLLVSLINLKLCPQEDIKVCFEPSLEIILEQSTVTQLSPELSSCQKIDYFQLNWLPILSLSLIQESLFIRFTV